MEKILIEIPEFCLVMLIGPSGSGKSHFASEHFGKYEVLSSDFFRGIVCGNPGLQSATDDAFECLYLALEKRLARKTLTVLDATNLYTSDREKARKLAKQYHCQVVAIVFNTPEYICQEQNKRRRHRHTPERVVSRQCDDLQRTLECIDKEHFYRVFVLPPGSSVKIDRKPLACDHAWLKGPFDIIGDVHGCYEELCTLLAKLGCKVDREKFHAVPPKDRRIIFLGDLGDRGHESLAVFRLVMAMVEQGHAFCVIGNHDFRLKRYLSGEKVAISQGIETTLAELEKVEPGFKMRLKKFLSALPDHLVLDGSRLVIAHAGIKEEMVGRAGGAVKAFCIYGDVDGTKDALGLPVRKDWAAAYAGNALIIYGHTPKAEPRFLNNTVCIDTGCVFGGKLTCFRYPEKEIASVPATVLHCIPPRPLR